MSDTDFSETADTTEPLTANERSAIDGLLRWQLGRRMTVCLLALADTHADELAALAKRLTSIEEIVVTPSAISPDEGLIQAARQDAEIVLVWLAADDEREVAAARALLERVDAMGLTDRSVVALIGPLVTRDLAHQLRFEEGYPAQLRMLTTLSPVVLRCKNREGMQKRWHSSRVPHNANKVHTSPGSMLATR